MLEKVKLLVAHWKKKKSEKDAEDGEELRTLPLEDWEVKECFTDHGKSGKRA